jgi:hypothetical protein
MKSLKTLSLLALCISMSACEMKKNLDEMHDSTGEMNVTTTEMNGNLGEMKQTTQTMSGTTSEMNTKMGQMAQTTDSMSKTTDDMKATTCEMYTALRQGDSLSARRNGMKAINDAEAGAPKISEAGKYFMSFEFQIWSNLCRDNKEIRLQLAAEAAKEFMRDVQQFIAPGQTEAMPFANPKLHGAARANREQSLNAIAAAMHLVNPKQEALMNKENQITMWEMIKTSLLASQQIATGKANIADFPEYVHQILIYEGVAKLLAQARYNYLGAMMISRASKIREGFVPYAKMRYISWTLDVSLYGQVEVSEFGVYLNGGNLAYEAMVKAGITPKINKDLRGILENMSISNQLKAAIKAPNGALPRVATEADFLKKLLTYRRYAGIKEGI